MTRWTIECYSEDCDSCQLTAPHNPTDGACPQSGECIYRAMVDRTEADLTFSMSNRSDVNWNKAIFPMLVARQTNSAGMLICAICQKQINTNSDGKISYVSKTGKTHVERPPIDHYNDDWKDRKRKVENSQAFQRADVAGRKKLLNNAFNADPLRITHRLCNLTR